MKNSYAVPAILNPPKRAKFVAHLIKTIGRKLKRPTGLQRQSHDALVRSKASARGKGATALPSAIQDRDLAQIAREAGL